MPLGSSSQPALPSREDLAALLDACPALLVVVDPQGAVGFANLAAREAFGVLAPGASILERADAEDLPALKELLRDTEEAPRPRPVRLRCTDDAVHRFEVCARPVPLEAPRPAFLVSCTRLAGDEAAPAHDALTELPNRAAFMERLQRSLGRARQREDYHFGLLVLDLDRFSLINNTLGDLGGDQVLRTTARRLLACVRPGDMVARIGPDQFAVIADHMRPDADTAVDASRVAERIQASAFGAIREETRALLLDATRVAERIQRQALSAPIELGAQEIFATASIGITVSTPDYASPEEMFRDADAAMHRAKAAGGGRYELFDRDMHERARARLRLETDLRRGIERGEFLAHYQPIVELASLRIAGLECLMRWNHPQRGLLPPRKFLEVAEEMGLLFQANVRLLREACLQAKAWRERHPEHARLSLSVNFSSLYFQSDDLVRAVALVLEEAGSAGRHLVLELTEGAMVRDVDRAVATLQALKGLGVEVHIDDFGTGYSSLSYLHRLPIGALKIDPSFTQRAATEPDAERMVRTIIELGHNLKRTVVAEGIETAAQLECVRGLGCDFGQGFYFSQPLDAEQTSALLANPPWLAATGR
jgi:diguanylate cyclase (GGDEF)-like protein